MACRTGSSSRHPSAHAAAADCQHSGHAPLCQQLVATRHQHVLGTKQRASHASRNKPTSCSRVVPYCCMCHRATLSYRLGMTGDGTWSPLLLLLWAAALQLLSARARNSCSRAEATVSPATIATARRPSCSMACLAASRAATLCVECAQVKCWLRLAHSTSQDTQRAATLQEGVWHVRKHAVG